MAGGKKISELTVDSELSGAELVPLVDGTTKRTTAGAIAALGLDEEDVQELIDANGAAYQGDAVLSEALAIPPSGYEIALEIPVTIREGKRYALAWRCPLHVNSGSGVSSFYVELFLGTASGLFQPGDVYVSGARQVITWGTADFAWTAGSAGCIPLVGTGSGDTPTPIEPGDYWLKMVVSETTNTSRGSVAANAMHRPVLQLLEFNAPEGP